MCGFDSCAHFAHVNLVRDRCLFCVRFLFVCTFGSCEFDSCFVCVFCSCTLGILVRVQFSFVCVLTRVPFLARVFRVRGSCAVLVRALILLADV